jgi:hypothetical protein
MDKPLPLPIHSYKIDTQSSARLVNTFAEATPQGAKGPVTLRRAPGILPFTTCGSGPGRGLHVMKGALYAVSGAQLYRVGSAADVTALGAIAGITPVSMADNGTQLAIIASGLGYVFASGLASITDPDFTSRHAGPCDFLDNFLLLVEENSGRFFCSDLADFTNYDALDFATAEGAPDDLLTIKVDHRAALLVGTDTSELWELDTSNGAGFPLTRIANGFIEIGGAAKSGICKQDNSVHWIANDRTFRRLVGATPVRTSQHGVERAWRKYARVDDASCVPYTLDGHLCVVVNFPSAAATWVLDCTTNEWHEREGYRTSAWDVSGIVKCYDKLFVQRASTGEIGILDAQTYTEWNNTLRAEWAYQPIYAQGNGVQLHRLEMGLETGVGLLSGQGSDPRILLELSRSGGREGTFKSFGSRSMGAQGKFKTRVHWDGLGSGNNTVIRASLSDPVPLTIWDTKINAEGLAA